MTNQKNILLISKDRSNQGSISLVTQVCQNLKAALTGKTDNYQQAIDCIQKQAPTLIVCDVSLHDEFDGIELMDRISAVHPYPVVFIAKSPDPRILEKAQGISVAGLVMKPFAISQLEITMELSLNS